MSGCKASLATVSDVVDKLVTEGEQSAQALQAGVVNPKLRTVLWGWLGTPLTRADRAAVERVRDGARGGACGGATEPLADRLAPLLGDAEIEALARRCERLLARGTMPAPDSDGPAIPWPPF